VVAYAGQAILHATIAALVIEALLRLWRVQDPGERLGLRWVALLSPLVLTATYTVLAPGRSSEWFAQRWAIFAGMHWDEVRVAGLGSAFAATVALSMLGIALYVRDAVPFLADRVNRQARDTALPTTHPAVIRARTSLGALPPAGFSRRPALSVIDVASPVLLCSGIDRTAVVISTGTLDCLDDDELAAALAHELAHLDVRDPLTGWWLMTVRTLQFFNPVVQIVARQAVQDLERRADLAVVRQGRARPLAGAILRLSRVPDTQSDLAPAPDRGSLLARVTSSAHRHAVDDRCQLLLEAAMPVPSPLNICRVALAGAALTLLLYLVV
jgi:Zn-dependent protease with chaperone function